MMRRSRPEPSPASTAPEGRVEALWVKRAHRGPMDPVSSIVLDEGLGIRGNADLGGWRQVTVIEAEALEALAERLGTDVPPILRRANVLVRGVRLADCRGKRLHLGRCQIEMRGETVPCERMDEAVPGLREAMKEGWAGGAFGRVVVDGEIQVGDPVRLVDA